MLMERSKVPSESKKRDFFPAKNPVDVRREVVWEIIPEYWRNMCEWVNVSVPLQIMLGMLFIIVQVSSLLGYFGKFNYFALPQECSHIL